MKKLALLLGLVGMLMLAASMAQARSDWAYYKEHPVQICDLSTGECFIADGYTGPRLFTDGEIADDGIYYLNCCACHGPDAPGNHGGPKNLQCP